MISSLGINVTWAMEWPSMDRTAQVDGPLNGWPAAVDALLFAEGLWIFLAGAELNVGVYRDATLIATNDLGIFSEIMEAAAFRGANEEQSYLLQMSLCVSGVSSAPVDISDTVCGAGS